MVFMEIIITSDCDSALHVEISTFYVVLGLMTGVPLVLADIILPCRYRIKLRK